MKMFIRYLRQNLTEIILFAVFALIFMFVFFLYNVNTEAVIYAAFLCFVILTVVFFIRFNKFLRRHKQREHILENILIMTEELPEPATSAEYDYIRMIKSLALNIKEKFPCISRKEVKHRLLFNMDTSDKNAYFCYDNDTSE